MQFPVTGYVVFVYNDKIGAHAPQFKSMDEAESYFTKTCRLKVVVNNFYAIFTYRLLKNTWQKL